MKNYVDALFTEPSGRRHGLAFLGISIFSLLAWVFFAVLHDGGHLLLFLGTGFALRGIAESLPSDRRRSAGRLRVGAVVLFALILVLTLTAPEIVVG